MSILCPNSLILYRQILHLHRENDLQCWGSAVGVKAKGLLGLDVGRRKRANRDMRAPAFWSEVSKPSSPVEMEPILDCEQFDQILDKAKELSHPLIVDWMAAWCRKCIYLKPKLEKLAAEYDSSKIKFYYIDVNKVPQSLVKRGNVSKMPTIQLWKDGEMKAEVIGGHKAWLVIEEVRDMIKQHHSF